MTLQVESEQARLNFAAEGGALMAVKREIIAASPLPSYPGHWLLTGRTEGEFGTWNVIRKPNGSYWMAIMPVYSNKAGPVEIGDKVVDSRAITQFELAFASIRQHHVQSAPGPDELHS